MTGKRPPLTEEIWIGSWNIQHCGPECSWHSNVQSLLGCEHVHQPKTLLKARWWLIHSVCQSTYPPLWSWATLRLIRSQNQVEEMRFLHDKVRSSIIQESPGVEALLIQTEKSRFMWFGLLTRIPPGQLPLQVYHHIWLDRDSVEDPGSAGEIIFHSWLRNIWG